MKRLPGSHRTLCLLAAAVAAAVPFTLFLASYRPSLAASESTGVLVIVLAHSSVPAADDLPTRNTKVAPGPSRRTSVRAEAPTPSSISIPSRPHLLRAPDQPASAPELTTEDRSAASTSNPLALDGQVLQNAAKASKSEVHRLAENAGVQLNTPRPTKDERLAAAIAGAAKPGCLDPDATKHAQIDSPVGLGGLFALPVWLLAIASDKCK